jgi:hypothetical protein
MSKEEMYQIAFELLTQDNQFQKPDWEGRIINENSQYIKARYGMTKPQAINIISKALRKLEQLENDYEVLEKTNKFINNMAEKQSKELKDLKSKVKRIKEVIDEGDRRVYYTNEDKYQKIRELVGEEDERVR